MRLNTTRRCANDATHAKSATVRNSTIAARARALCRARRPRRLSLATALSVMMKVYEGFDDEDGTPRAETTFLQSHLSGRGRSRTLRARLATHVDVRERRRRRPFVVRVFRARLSRATHRRARQSRGARVSAATVAPVASSDGSDDVTADGARQRLPVYHLHEERQFDVIVVGAGHADEGGARRVATRRAHPPLTLDRIAWQPCNPAGGARSPSSCTRTPWAARSARWPTSATSRSASSTPRAARCGRSARRRTRGSTPADAPSPRRATSPSARAWPPNSSSATTKTSAACAPSSVWSSAPPPSSSPPVRSCPVRSGSAASLGRESRQAPSVGLRDICPPRLRDGQAQDRNARARGLLKHRLLPPRRATRGRGRPLVQLRRAKLRRTRTMSANDGLRKTHQLIRDNLHETPTYGG